ncbi:MAG: hypothetical protein OXG18_00715 [Gemmatimonadetes bacterium]|nr:hypothetical protein [Gemmatimonadota bacterium]
MPRTASPSSLPALEIGGDRRAECRSARESWPAGLSDALKGEGIGSPADAATVQ